MTTTTNERPVLATIDRREGEQLRVTLSEYHGSTYADIRVWWRTNDGGWAPSKKGVTFGLDAIEVIVAALQKAKAGNAGRQP